MTANAERSSDPQPRLRNSSKSKLLLGSVHVWSRRNNSKKLYDALLGTPKYEQKCGQPLRVCWGGGVKTVPTSPIPSAAPAGPTTLTPPAVGLTEVQSSNQKRPALLGSIPLTLNLQASTARARARAPKGGGPHRGLLYAVGLRSGPRHRARRPEPPGCATLSKGDRPGAGAPGEPRPERAPGRRYPGRRRGHPTLRSCRPPSAATLPPGPTALLPSPARRPQKPPRR